MGPVSPNPQRHVVLTAYLWFGTLASIAAILLNLLAGSLLAQNFPQAPPWATPALVVGGVWNTICYLALFRWRKWGFYGLCVAALLTFGINTAIGVGLGRSLVGLGGVGLLYLLLQLGGEDKSWSRLK